MKTFTSYLLLAGILHVFYAVPAHADFITIQPDAALGSDTGYIVTYSWEGGFGTPPGGANNGASMDDKTTLANGDYVIPSGTFAGLEIGYGHNNNSGTLGDNHVNGPSGVGHLDWEGIDPNAMVDGSAARESALSQIGLSDGGNSFLNNTVNPGALLIYGSGVQGVLSLTSHNGIDSSALYGGSLGDPFAVGFNDNSFGQSDFIRLIVLDAEQTSFPDTGLAIVFLPHAADGGFLNLFTPGVFTDGTHELTVTTDPDYIATIFVVPEPSTFALIGFFGSALLFARRRRC